jgi:hypothetical protein
MEVGVPAAVVTKRLNRHDGAAYAPRLAQDYPKKVEDALLGAMTQFAEQLPVILEEPPQVFRHAEYVLPVRSRVQDISCSKDSIQSFPVNQVEQFQRRAARFLVADLPLLHSGDTCVQDSREDCLAEMGFFAELLNLPRRHFLNIEAAERLELVHPALIDLSNFVQIGSHFVDFLQNSALTLCCHRVPL